MTTTEHGLEELRREATYGSYGEEVERDIPKIDMSNFFARKAEITEDLWQAATGIGFFQLFNHGIPETLIDEAFALSARFFDLPQEAKAHYPLKPGTNAGWEYKAQVRPSTGTADQKESYQITLPRMKGLWPTGAEVAQFKSTMLAFERHNWALAMRVLSCFADRLGFETDTFTEGHDPEDPGYQSTLRLIHYLGMEDAKPEDFKFWRAGAHTDFDCLTLLHQKEGQGGLQLCPGKDAQGRAVAWTDVPPLGGVVTCNIGDMLMRWSDDKLLSNLHRVRMPKPGESLGPRYSMAYFAQANMETVLQGPEGKYEAMTGHDYIQMRLGANFGKK
ncbi:isopenicillin N synthase family dioxygenase [Palleronia sp. LCG004]|uniref:isopenicillin N synthase family dioxygenase n=1 Tax=Palleronia sp. LCG004 TaxID=3079304 RepID=UPI002943E0A2|nr:2-oxoglutarate and iron-dependent oxygenase domain-containing protein [Palleronia sp. LCG004]WOI55803.1 2-oxoglutarate and iron-dependent oxygenase domain-containing protein [Palleronia sp. LCG004]